MGGTKKKTLAQTEKSQNEAPKNPEKKTKEVKVGTKQTASPIPKFDESHLREALLPLKAITIYGTAKALGTNASVALSLLRSLEARGAVVKVGGYSGHYVWRFQS